VVRLFRVVIATLLGAALVASCVVYEPVPVYTSRSSFERAWNAALGATQDAGVRIVTSDPGAGLIRGQKDGIDVTVSVVRQADGSTRVQFDAKGSWTSPLRTIL
jgi:hypothetical protein